MYWIKTGAMTTYAYKTHLRGMLLKHGIAVIFTIICLLCAEAIGALCTGGDDLGKSNVNSQNDELDTNTNQQYFMTDAEFISPCCGAVAQWKFYAGATGTISLQVWRPLTGSSAILVGENTINVDSVGEYTYAVPTVSQIPIETSDIIGWYTETTDIITYDDNAGGWWNSNNDNNYIETVASSPAEGDTVSYSNRFQDRLYAVYATLDAQPAPTITNLPDTVYDYASLISTGTLLFTLTSSSGTSTFTLDNISPSAHFSVSPTTGEITATTSSVSETTYTLTISVAETCSDSSSETLTIVLSATAPVWSNLDAVISVSKTKVSTTAATYTVEATNPVVNGSVSYILQSITPASGGFGVDAFTGEVTSTTSQVTGGTYTLDIRANDVYGNYVDGTLTITVINLAPEINSLPDVVDVSESAVDETLLHTINVTDADGDVVACTVTPSPSGSFLTKYIIVDGIFSTGIYLQANPSLDYDTTYAYEISVSCTDGEASSSTEILYIYITPNNVPVITNLQNTTSILSTTPSSTTIFQILSFDVENDATYYTLTCTIASPCPFSIYSDGSISLTTSLFSTATKAYELDISVRDDHSSSGNHRLTVFVSDLNTQPKLNNLPASIQIPEDTVVGTTLFDISVYDEDGDTLHGFAVSFNPATSVALFQVNSTTGEVVLTTALNYLTQNNTYDITVKVSDAQSTSASEILTIEVVDVNQIPVLYQVNYKIQIDEGSAGSSAPDPNFNVYDPDGDTLTYSWGVGGDDTSGFAIDSNDGTVTLTIDLDVDDTSVITHYVWLIVVSDPEGLSCTATLTLSVIDINDNIPTFDSAYYAAVVSSNAGLATSVLQVSSTDDDKSEANREIEYTVENTNLFGIDNTGKIFVSQSLSDSVGTVETFTVRVQNPGESSSRTASVSISVEEPPDDKDFFDNTANIVWVSLVCIFGPPVVIGLIYLSYVAYTKWSGVPAKGLPMIQVAPSDTKMAPPSRASLVTRGTAVTPSDIRVIDDRWEAWKIGGWEA